MARFDNLRSSMLRNILAFLSLLALAPSHASAELISGGDFENEADGEIPAAWVIQGGTTEEVRVVKEQGPAEGEKVLLLAGRGGANVSVTTDKIPVDPSKPLVISGWMKASGPQGSTAGGYVMLTFYDDAQAPLGRDESSPDRTSRNLFIFDGEDWKEFRKEFLPASQWSSGMAGQFPLPARSAFFDLKLTTLGYPGNLWFDGLSAVQE